MPFARHSQQLAATSYQCGDTEEVGRVDHSTRGMKAPQDQDDKEDKDGSDKDDNDDNDENEDKGIFSRPVTSNNVCS